MERASMLFTLNIWCKHRVAARDEEAADAGKPADRKAKGGEEQHAEHTPAAATAMKYQMDEDLLPERMREVEDDKVQNISEKCGLMYPDDNSIMRVDHYSLGG